MSLRDAVETGMAFSPPDPPCEQCAAWRAHAEALAEVLQAIREEAAERTSEETPTEPFEWMIERASAALARLPAAALAEASNMWRAHAEALAGALEWIAGWQQDQASLASAQTLHYDMAGRAARALARLPADTLAERRALEGCADVLALTRKHQECCVMAPEWWFLKVSDALAALDAVRRESGA